VQTRKGRAAVTTYRVMQRLDGFTLLQVQPETGRTHQIRVHLSALGHAVVGDKVWKERFKRFRGRVLTFNILSALYAPPVP